MPSKTLHSFTCPCGCGTPMVRPLNRVGTTKFVCPVTRIRKALPKTGRPFARKQWDDCRHPGLLRSALYWASDEKRTVRKLRLTVTAIVTQSFDWCKNTTLQEAVAAAELLADDRTPDDLAALSAKLEAGRSAWDEISPVTAGQLCVLDHLDLGGHPFSLLDGHYPTEATAAYRDVFANPFRHPRVLAAWRTSTALDLAAGVYADKAFDRLPILADALEDAGCDELPLLHHLRGDGPHFRGCWALDAVLGRVV